MNKKKLIAKIDKLNQNPTLDLLLNFQFSLQKILMQPRLMIFMYDLPLNAIQKYRFNFGP